MGSVIGMRGAVYTAVFGNYDELNQPAEQDIDCDFICFTDRRMPARVGAWRVVHIETRPAMHPRMQAKRFKLLSHKVFRNGHLAWRYRLTRGTWQLRSSYAGSIWVDGNLRITSKSFARDILSAASDVGWAMFRHPDRDCIFEEATFSDTMEKYHGLPLFKQVETYRRAGVPEHGGLFACGIIARREPLSALLCRVNELWWEENMKWTYQDQLSLPYVLRTTGAEVGIIPGYLWKNPWFDLKDHRTAQ